MSFQLLKKRDFNAFISDSFGFFKSHGKNYFKGYLLINGGLLAIMLLCIYFIAEIWFGAFFASVQDPYYSTSFENRLAQQSGTISLFGIAILIVSILIMLVSYLYPVGYLHKVANGKDLSTASLFDFVKKKFVRGVIFLLASLFIFLPIFSVVIFIFIMLSMVVIGIPLLIISIPAMMSWFMLSFYDYLSTGNSFFTSFGVGFNFLKKRFWPIVGSTLIIHMIINVISSFIMIIPYIIGFASFISSMDSIDNSANGVSDGLSFFLLMLMIALLISTIATFILQNLVFVNQGIIYYSSVEERDNTAITSEIDNIGNDSE